MRRGTLWIAGATAAALAGLLAAGLPAAQPQTGGTTGSPNPCIRLHLRCPDLYIRHPYELYVQREGHELELHSTSSLINVGKGPLEIHGTRTSATHMRTYQTIYRRGRRGYVHHPLSNGLYWKWIPNQGHYWKFRYAAHFEIYKVDSRGRRIGAKRFGPKLIYCLRDLHHPRPGLPGSPKQFHYPGCSQDYTARHDVLGTSVGWSDDYPSTYYQQYINITGLRGRYRFVLVADPLHHIWEMREDNNASSVIVNLPWRGKIY